MADGIAARFGFTPYSAAQERLLAQVLAMPSSGTQARAGIRPGGGFEVTIGGSPETVTVAPGSCVITDPNGGGTYMVVIPQPVVLALPTRPAAGSSQIVEVIAQILNSDERPTDGAREVDLVLIAGNAAPSPTPPTIPAGQLRLRRLAVPSSGTVSASLVAPRTVAAGGVLPVASQAERDAISPMWTGLIVSREDLDGALQRRTADGRWVTLKDADSEQRGKTSITPVANTPTMKHVDFPHPYTSIPSIQVSADTSLPGTRVLEVSFSNVTTDGVDLYITRSDTFPTTVHWSAGPITV